MLIFGRLYTIYSMKKLYVSSVFVFIVGSIVTTTSPTSSAFIFGRTLTGFGAAGIHAGCQIMLAHSTPLNRRPTYFAMLGAVECSAIAFGPLIAGSIARFTTWRVCFVIVIAIAIIDALIIWFGVGPLRRPEHEDLNWKEKLQRIDWAGLIIELPMTACLVLALQWAGTTYAWSNWRIILLLVMTGVLLAVFFLIEHKFKDTAMLPLKMLKQRTVTFANLCVFGNFSALWVVSFYLPIYFQAIRGATTLGSGLMILPLAITQVLAALLSGPITSKIGYSNVNEILGTTLSVIGIGLLTTLHPHSSAGEWIGYQILYGSGIGIAFQPPFIAVQAALPSATVPLALVLLSFTQIFGGILALSVAQNVFLNRLAGNLVNRVPQVDPGLVLDHGALGLIQVVPDRYRGRVLEAYNDAVVSVMFIALGFACLAVVASLGLEWKSVKKDDEKNDTVQKAEDQA